MLANLANRLEASYPNSGITFERGPTFDINLMTAFLLVNPDLESASFWQRVLAKWRASGAAFAFTGVEVLDSCLRVPLPDERAFRIVALVSNVMQGHLLKEQAANHCFWIAKYMMLGLDCDSPILEALEPTTNSTNHLPPRHLADSRTAQGLAKVLSTGLDDRLALRCTLELLACPLSEIHQVIQRYNVEVLLPLLQPWLFPTCDRCHTQCSPGWSWQTAQKRLCVDCQARPLVLPEGLHPPVLVH